MGKAKVEIKIEPYPKGGWYVAGMLLKELAVKFGGNHQITSQ